MMTDKQLKEFEDLSRPLIKWLNDNSAPHAVIIIEVDSARLLSGELGFYTKDFIKD